MTNEMRLFLKNSVKFDIIIGVGISIILCMLLGEVIPIIYFLGLGVSVVNFIVSGIILDKSLNSSSKVFKILFPVSFVIRIVCIAFIGLLFSEKLSYLLAYIGGFISHFPISILSWIRRQKGSE